MKKKLVFILVAVVFVVCAIIVTLVFALKGNNTTPAVTTVSTVSTVSTVQRRVCFEERNDDYEYAVYEDGTAEITRYNGDERDLTIPAVLDGYPVVSIGKKAFYDRSNLVSITIPDNITSIGDEAFLECYYLTSVTISDSVTSIGASIFSNCKNLTQVKVSPSHPTLETIDGVLFSKADKRLVWYPMTSTASSYSIPQGTMVIGDYAFYRCENLNSVTLPDSITSIGNYAFSECTNLTDITIPKNVSFIGNNPFSNCKSLTQLNISPDNQSLETIDGGLISKPDQRFVWYPTVSSAYSYAIPQGIQVIGDKAFYYCKTLVCVRIPNSVTSIGEYAFYNCSNLSDAWIPNGVISIEHGAFEDCNMTSVTIPDSVTTIGEYAFSSVKLERVTIPDSVTSIGKGAFSFCSYRFVITVNKGSYAEQYCRTYQLNHTTR